MVETLKDTIGFTNNSRRDAAEEQRFREYVNLKLATRGFSVVGKESDYPFLEIGRSMIANFQERMRLLSDYLCPADQYIHDFLVGYLADTEEGASRTDPWLPPKALVLERHGLARLLSLPAHSDKFESPIVSSYRVHQGVCHNPAKDRRTTQGVFHVTEGGLPVPADKLAVPKKTFARMLIAALNPPDEFMVLPFTSGEPEPAKAFVSLLLRPTICPEVQGFTVKKSMETRFFAPGGLVSNLDFVESIFGNAGDPFLPQNDARLDVEHWSGHTGCVILAPHLITLKKKDLGLPHVSEATERQKRDGMCWENEDELYNGGSAFKLTCRDKRGVVVTLIADNYFGYCKKEVKTQISYAANLYGLAEEEHAGGALVFPSFDLGEDFALSEYNSPVDHTFAEVCENYGSIMNIKPEGYGVDKTYPEIVYLPEDAQIDLHTQFITWEKDGQPQKIHLSPSKTYVMPSGYKVMMSKPTAGQRWRLVGTNAEGTFCHKPCTVSGGGKSEISKALSDAMITGPVIMPDFERDMDLAVQVLEKAEHFQNRFKNPKEPGRPSRPLLSPQRSFGSVIRLFSQSPEYTDEYNEWIASIPYTVRDFIFILKRFYKPDWGDNWSGRFRVDSINGMPGFELKYRNALVITRYLRVGYEADGSWRLFGVRKDFQPAVKLQREDDISASITVPHAAVKWLHPDVSQPAYKFVSNCEYRLFQRPDDAVNRGYDKKTEDDFSKPGNFFSNYEPMTRDEAKELVADAIRFEQFTKPLQKMIRQFAKADSPDYFVSSAHPRIVDGARTKNPRYLQTRPDLEDPMGEYLGDIGARLYRRVPLGEALASPVNSVLPGRRNNPPDHAAGIRPLAVYSPVHFQELPELFMDFIASLTGRSPSTTGAGSEGALTKGPFNALLPISDVNNALLSYIVAGYHGFSTAAGYIGPKFRVDHDISLVVPEVWSRMFINEREPAYLIERGHLEKVEDFEHGGKVVKASRLGYRITESFVNLFFGRVFNDPGQVFEEEMLRPEKQNLDDFVDGVKNIVETQQKVARLYFEDGSLDLAIPPLRALLHIMAEGAYEGKDESHPEIRALFDREAVMSSDWYAERLKTKLEIKKDTLSRHISSLEDFLARQHYGTEAERLHVAERLETTKAKLQALIDDPQQYLDSITGTIGADPMLYQPLD